jgi:hypothetical protein
MSDTRGPLIHLPYALLCTLIGLALGWIPMFVHGPIPQKYDVLYIRGAVAVWGWYTARLIIGFMIGITRWPQPWYVRGPLCGLLMMLPLSLVSLATPGCGLPCMILNLTTATLLGAAVGGLAFFLSGQHRG